MARVPVDDPFVFPELVDEFRGLVLVPVALGEAEIVVLFRTDGVQSGVRLDIAYMDFSLSLRWYRAPSYPAIIRSTSEKSLAESTYFPSCLVGFSTHGLTSFAAGPSPLAARSLENKPD